MNRLLKTTANGSLNISAQSKVLKRKKPSRGWYTHRAMTWFTPPAAVAIDVIGFNQIISKTIVDSQSNRIMVITALAAAFELAPLYIGYAINLKCYKKGSALLNFVLAFSTISCLLGVIANTIFRALTMNIAYTSGTMYNARLPITILMCILPVITTLINLVVGCLCFDPLLFDLLRLSKRINTLKSKQQEIQAYIDDLDNDCDTKILYNDVEQEHYNCVNEQITATKDRLHEYVAMRTHAVYKTTVMS